MHVTRGWPACADRSKNGDTLSQVQPLKTESGPALPAFPASIWRAIRGSGTGDKLRRQADMQDTGDPDSNQISVHSNASTGHAPVRRLKSEIRLLIGVGRKESDDISQSDSDATAFTASPLLVTGIDGHVDKECMDEPRFVAHASSAESLYFYPVLSPLGK